MISYNPRDERNYRNRARSKASRSFVRKGKKTVPLLNQQIQKNEEMLLDMKVKDINEFDLDNV